MNIGVRMISRTKRNGERKEKKILLENIVYQKEEK